MACPITLRAQRRHSQTNAVVKPFSVSVESVNTRPVNVNFVRAHVRQLSFRTIAKKPSMHAFLRNLSRRFLFFLCSLHCNFSGVNSLLLSSRNVLGVNCSQGSLRNFARKQKTVASPLQMWWRRRHRRRMRTRCRSHACALIRVTFSWVRLRIRSVRRENSSG